MILIYYHDGWKLRGWPVMTIVRGKMIMELANGAKMENLFHGHFLPLTKFNLVFTLYYSLFVFDNHMYRQ